jgi:hypothetical protein
VKLDLKKRSDGVSGRDGRANKESQQQSKQDQLKQSRALEDAGLGASAGASKHDVEAHKKSPEKTEQDAQNTSNAANDAAGTSGSDADAVDATVSDVFDAGAKNDGKLTTDNITQAYQSGFDKGRQVALDDLRSKPREQQLAAKKEAKSTLDGLDGAGGIKKTLGGLRFGLRRLRLSFALLLAAIGALAYFGYQCMEYAQCMRDFRKKYTSLLDDEGDLEKELEKATEALATCIGNSALSVAMCDARAAASASASASGSAAAPAPVSSGSSLAVTRAPQECDAFLARWCLLQNAERELQDCQNEMPLYGVLDGALAFIRDVAQDVVETVADVVEVVAENAVEIAGGVAGKVVGGVVESAKSAFTPLLVALLVALAIAAAFVVYKLQARRY